jgi:serine protease AprX
VRGLATAPNVSLPTSGAALPGPVDITVAQKLFTLAPIADIQGHPAQAQIESVLKNRMMDTFGDGTFRPDENVFRSDFAVLLYLNTPLRQSVGSAPRFNDVTGNVAAIAESISANGSTLRDWDFTPQGMLPVTGSSFNPGGKISRSELAVALVRALGLDAEARALAGSTVTATYNGQAIPVADNGDIPAELRGYMQLALDRGILQAYFSVEQGQFDLQPTLKARVQPEETTTRAWTAYALDNFRKHFVAGN